MWVVTSTVEGMIPTRLQDTWHVRELPVLIAAARIVDSGKRVSPHELAEVEELELELDDVVIACEALVPTYLHAGRAPRRGGDIRGMLIVTGLTDEGRRATCLWPDGDSAVDQLLDALRQAENLAIDPDDKDALRKAGGQLASVIAEVIAAVVARQAGVS